MGFLTPHLRKPSTSTFRDARARPESYWLNTQSKSEDRSGYCFTPAPLNGRLSISLELLDSAQVGPGTAIYVALVNMS